MRVLLKLTLDCDADAAWRALRSPSVLGELYAPLFQLEPVLADAPTTLDAGSDAPVRMSLAGLVPLGSQLIHVTHRATTDSRGPVRILRDSGMPLTGPLASLTVWDHQMAVSEAPGDPTRTLWRDRLVFDGPGAFALWPTLWSLWQWRGSRLRALAPTWAYDPPTDADAAPA